MVKSIKFFVSSLKTGPNYHLPTRIKYEKMSIKVLTIAFSLCLSGKKVSYTVDRRQRKVNPHKTDRIIDRKYLPPCDIYLECVYVVYKWRAEGGGMAPPNLGITKRSEFVNKRTFNFCDNCSGTSSPSAPHLTVSLHLCSSKCYVHVKVAGPLRAPC